MTDVFEPVREAQRIQRERFHVQQSLTDDLPVLIPAAPLPAPADIPLTTGAGSSLNTNGSGHAHSEGAREAGATGGF